MKSKRKNVYVALSADILHEAHINILKIANKLGDVTVGLLTDKAIASFKGIPLLNYKQRLMILNSVKYVKKIVPQETLDYSPNLKKLKPDNFMIITDGFVTQDFKRIKNLFREKPIYPFQKNFRYNIAI